MNVWAWLIFWCVCVYDCAAYAIENLMCVHSVWCSEWLRLSSCRNWLRRDFLSSFSFTIPTISTLPKSSATSSHASCYQKKVCQTKIIELWSNFAVNLFELVLGSVNFLTADGTKFTHPLYHLGKTAKDLPVLAIDSFKHMYLWKHDPTSDVTWDLSIRTQSFSLFYYRSRFVVVFCCSQPGLLKQFIADLHSGKLHREFHNGPDPTTKSVRIFQLLLCTVALLPVIN